MRHSATDAPQIQYGCALLLNLAFPYYKMTASQVMKILDQGMLSSLNSHFVKLCWACMCDGYATGR